MDPFLAPDPMEQFVPVTSIYEHTADTAATAIAANEATGAYQAEVEIDQADHQHTTPTAQTVAPNVPNNSRSSSLNTDEAADLAAFNQQIVNETSPTNPPKRRRKITPQAKPKYNMRSRQHYTNPDNQSDEDLGQLDVEIVETTTTPKKHG